MALTLDQLAHARGIDPMTLRALGWTDDTKGVRVPWSREGGGTAIHTRTRMEKDGDGPRWTWHAYDAARILPFGADRIERLDRKNDSHTRVLVVTESEVDAVCLWQAGISAIATGGTQGWQARWWGLLSRFERIVVWIEDAASVALARRVMETRPENGPVVAECYSRDRDTKDAGRITAARNGTAAAQLQAIVEAATIAELYAGDDLAAAVAERLEKVSRATPNGDRGARCPFHHDRHPSFSFNAAVYHCFSCGAKGTLPFLAACVGLIVPDQIDLSGIPDAASRTRPSSGGTRTQGGAGRQDSARGSLPPVPPFPVWVLPGAFRRLVEDAAAAIGCPPDAVAVPLLTYAAGVIGNLVRLRLKPGFELYPVLWTAVVMPPGSGKSPADAAARRPLEVLQKEALATYRAEKATYEDALNRWTAAKDKESRGPKPRPPRLEHFFSSDITTEAIAQKLEDDDPGMDLGWE